MDMKLFVLILWNIPLWVFNFINLAEIYAV